VFAAMAMRKNQPKVQAMDLPVSVGAMSSASFKPGENSAITQGRSCGSTGIAIAKARNPNARLSTANRIRRSGRDCPMSADSNRGLPAPPLSCVKMSRPKPWNTIPSAATAR
jgi:hypothetical protein